MEKIRLLSLAVFKLWKVVFKMIQRNCLRLNKNWNLPYIVSKYWAKENSQHNKGCLTKINWLFIQIIVIQIKIANNYENYTHKIDRDHSKDCLSMVIFLHSGWHHF